jgi:hypothetical protein
MDKEIRPSVAPQTTPYLLKELLCDRREALVPVPDQVHLHFQAGRQRAKNKTALRGRVDQIVQRQKHAQPSFANMEPL